MNEETIIYVLFGVVIIWIILFNHFRPLIKGKYGETKISIRLKWLNSKKYRVINNALIRIKSRSSQIDHVIISKYGVFVIETKNYKGWIFGHESSEYWTQTLYKNKYKLRNPVSQCWGHIKTLKTALTEFSNIPYHPIVVFTGSAKLKKITSKIPVIKANKLKRCIKRYSKEEYLSNDEVDQIYQKLLSLNSTDKVSRRMHIKKAKYIHRKGIKYSSCPRCGGTLLLKNGKFGKFYSCSSYPRCDYSKSYRR